MAGVDAELFWGDERLGITSHPLDAVIEPAHGPFSLRPFERDGDEYVLTVPARAAAEVRTANGMRDMATLRVLGQLAPHPSIEGSAQIRLRRLRDAESIPEGVVLTDRIEARLGLDGWWLRVSVAEASDLRAPPRFERGAVRSGLALGAFVLTLLAGVLTALGAVEPPPARLGLERLDETTVRLPPVRWVGAERDTEREETKHDVMPRALGGGDILDALAAPEAAPDRRRAPNAADTGAEPAPEPEPTDTPAASWRGPAEGYGGGLGEPVRARPPRVRFGPRAGSRGVHCQRTWSGRCRTPVDDAARRRTIASVVRRHLAGVRRCYERGLERQAGLAGGVTLRWSIASDGVVHRVEIEDDELRAPVVTECMRRQALRWHFPSWVGPASVQYPLELRASEVLGDEPSSRETR